MTDALAEVRSTTTEVGRAHLKDTEAASNFIFGGNATFTVVSLQTGVRKTYRLVKAKRKPGSSFASDAYFAHLLIGSDNCNDYRYLGFIFPSDDGFKAKPSKNIWGKSALDGLLWVIRNLESGRTLEQAEIWHEGRCGCCGRKLTVPESIASGIGPICAGK